MIKELTSKCHAIFVERQDKLDLGIPIVFSSPMRMSSAHQGESISHGVVAAIHYSAVDGKGTDGVLIYLKATLSGDEPADVKNYAASHPEFPHESTADQWFGESQFESYRVLGPHTVDEVAGVYDGRAGIAGLIVTMMESAARRKDGRSSTRASVIAVALPFREAPNPRGTPGRFRRSIYRVRI